jgi:Tfp pilus assembly protein PilF
MAQESPAPAQPRQQGVLEYRPREQQQLIPTPEIPQTITQAIQQKQWTQIIELSRVYPQQFTCAQITNLWALAEAYYAQEQRAQTRAVYAQILTTCLQSGDKIATLYKARERLPHAEVVALLLQAEITIQEPEAKAQLADFRYYLTLDQLNAAVQARDFPTVLALEASLRETIYRKRDVSRALLLGWSHFQRGAFAEAEQWFTQALLWDSQQEEAAYGLALTKRQQGDRRGAEVLAQPWAAISPRMQSLLAEMASVPVVDDSSLWELLKQQRYGELRREISRLREGNPSWEPPPKLLVLLQAGESRQRITQASAQQQWAQIITLSRRYPQQFTCRQISHLWALADAYHAQGQPTQTQTVYERILLTCDNNRDKLVTLQRALGQLPPKNVELLFQPATKTIKDVEAQERLAEIQYQFYISQMSRAFTTKAFTQAREFGEKIVTTVRQKRDVSSAILLGWSHFHREDMAQARTWFEQVLAWDAQQEEAAYGLALVKQQQSDLSGATTLTRQWKDISPRMRSLLGELLLAQAVEHRREKRYVESLAFLQESAQYSPPQPAINLLQAWNHYALGQIVQARVQFEQVLAWDAQQEEAAYGLALVKQQQSDWQGAEMLARQWKDQSPRMQSLLSELLLAQAGARHQEKRYGDSLALLQESEQHQPLQREASLLKAWNYYQLGQTTQAAQEFETLYRTQPDKKSAEGVFFSYARAKQWSKIENLTQNVSGPLTTLWTEQVSQRYYARKLFLVADRITPAQFPALDNIDSPHLSLGAIVRLKSGTEGLSQLMLWKLPFAEGTLVHTSGHELRLRLERVTLDSGTLAPNAQIGTVPVTPTPFRFSPTTELDNSVEPQLAYRFHGWFSPYVEFGSTPLGGEVSSRVTGKVGFVKHEEESHWGAEVFSQPVRESMLSYTGIVDPFSGTAWGRVLRTGIRLFGFTRVSAQWGLFGQVSGAWLEGRQVDDNQQVAVNLSVSRTFQPKGFDYLSLGPTVSFEHYQNNLSQFTLGHGGYFSPSRLFQLGLATNFLTTEGQWFVLSGNASLGFQTQREESSPFFPLNPDGRSYAADSSTGITGSLELKGIMRLSEHWQLGGGVSVRQTADFADQAGMLFLRFLFKPRTAVLSTDIPSPLFQTIY